MKSQILDFLVASVIGVAMAYALVHWSMDDQPVYVAQQASDTESEGK